MKRKQTVLAAGAVLLVLAAAFWYGGDAPGLQGWSLSQTSSQSAPASSQASPAAPSGASSSVEPEGDNPSSDGATVEGSSSGGGETSAEIQRPAGTEEPSTDPAQPAGDGGDASGQPEDGGQSPAQSTPPQSPAPGGGGGAGEGQQAPEEQQTAVSVSIDCSTVLDHLDWLAEGKEEILPPGGVVLAETQVEPEAGETAFSLLQRVTREQGIHLEASFTPGTGSAYVEGMANLYEFDCGQRSGWLYLVNGVSPGYSSSEYVLEPGDRVEWVYTCDMGRDVGAAAAGG